MLLHIACYISYIVYYLCLYIYSIQNHDLFLKTYVYIHIYIYYMCNKFGVTPLHLPENYTGRSFVACFCAGIRPCHVQDQVCVSLCYVQAFACVMYGI